MNLMRTIRERIGAVIAAVLGAAFFCLCGAFFTFYLAPRQALEAGRIRGLPQQDAAYVDSAGPGADILVTGRLVDNPAPLEDRDLVVYVLEEWRVTPPDPDNEGGNPTGEWTTLEKHFPDLLLEVDKDTVLILSGPQVALSGDLREDLLPGEGLEAREPGGETLPDGTLRYRGLANGDLATVFGTKGSSGGIVPENLFAGDRAAFEQSERDAARGMLIGGAFLMACAPVILVGGGLAALFGRRWRRGIFR